jgi:twitching motility two-component system response regulator PilH
VGLFDKKDKKKSGKVKILSIDDSSIIQELLAEVIYDMGYEFISAYDGEAGIRLAEEAQPDLILLDVQMPGISGVRTCQLLGRNSKTSHIPVIMCTAESQMDTVERAIKSGAAGYINKPINEKQLRTKLAQMLKKVRGTADVQPVDQVTVQAPEPLPQAGTVIPSTKPGLPPPPPVVIPHPCAGCGKYQVYIPQYKAYYCYTCNNYPAQQPAPPTISRHCPICDAELAFFHDQGKWFCLTCQKPVD